jgi:acetyltransferase-like isoleucine patch superfamily enzyme
MSLSNTLRQKIKRGETPFYRFLRRMIIEVFYDQSAGLPSPRLLRPLLRFIYDFQYAMVGLTRFVITFLFRQPLFRARCATVGKRLILRGKMPFVSGPVDIHIGEGVTFGAGIDILSGGPVERPRLIIKDRAGVGSNTVIAVSMEVVIEEDAMVSYDCRISDTDGHPRQADLRALKVAPEVRDIRPVRICRDAMVGNGSYIMKGVTIGEGAIISANSVVINDIPAYAIALGNPAEVVVRGGGRPKDKNWRKDPSGAAPAS